MSILAVVVVLITTRAPWDVVSLLVGTIPGLLLAGAVVGWLWARRVLRARGRTRPLVLILVALTATVLGALALAWGLWVHVLLTSDPATPQVRSVLWLAVFWVGGLVLLGLPSLLLTIPIAVHWRAELEQRCTAVGSMQGEPTLP